MQRHNLPIYYYIGKTLEFYLEFKGFFPQGPVYSLLHQNEKENTKIVRKINLNCRSPFKVCKDSNCKFEQENNKSTCSWQKHYCVMRTGSVLQNPMTRINHCSVRYRINFPRHRLTRICFYKIGIILYFYFSLLK